MTSRVLESTRRFERALKRYVAGNSHRQRCVEETLRRMEADIFDPRLKTHTLSGKLDGFLASSCGYDCRIVFALRTDPEGSVEKITLTNVGTHEEVY